MKTLAILLLVAVLGYGIILRPLALQAGDRADAIERERLALAVRIAGIRGLGPLERERSELERELRALHLDAGRATTLARFLALASEIASGHRVRIAALDEDPPVSDGRNLTHTAAPTLDELPLRLTLYGNYVDVMATLRQLVAAPLAARLAVDALAPDARSDARRPQLLTALHAVLLRRDPNRARDAGSN